MNFSGAKLMLFLGPDLLTILRDDDPGIPWPGHWDLPGGGREKGETPVECVLRETREEVGLSLSPRDLTWSREFAIPGGSSWFFAAHTPAELAKQVRLGDEGQRWQLMRPEHYCAHPATIPRFAERIRIYLSEMKPLCGTARKNPPRFRRGV